MAQLLFSKLDVYRFVEVQQRSLRSEYDLLTDDQALNDVYVSELRAKYRMAVPKLDLANKYATREERTLTRDEFAGRNTIGAFGQQLVHVQVYTIHVPYAGDRKLFDVRPSTVDGFVPFGEVTDSEVLLTFKVNDPLFNLEGEIQRQISMIATKLRDLSGSSLYLEEQINNTLALCRQARARSAETRKALASPNLSFPIKEIQITTAPPRQQLGSARPTLKPEQQKWDVFISHASEDKEYARELAKALESRSVRAWFDETSLQWGESLRSSIDKGLMNSRFVVVVLSKAFLKKKKWTEYELSSAFALESVNERRILPIWHEITVDDLKGYSPGLTDRLSRESDKHSVEDIVTELQNLVGKAIPPNL